jgi:hypothetical protein
MDFLILSLSKDGPRATSNPSPRLPPSPPFEGGEGGASAPSSEAGSKRGEVGLASGFPTSPCPLPPKGAERVRSQTDCLLLTP